MGAHDEFVELLTTAMRNNGMDELSSRLVGILYIKHEPVSLEDLAKDAGYSLSAVSTTMKFLSQLGLVKTIKKPGSRKRYYYFEKDLISLSLDLARKKYQSNILPILERIPQIVDKYKEEKANSKEELTLLESYFEQTKEMEKIISKLINMLEVSQERFKNG